MVTLHHNGSIVVHPDNSTAYRDRQRRYSDTGKCRYGCDKITCRQYQVEYLKNPFVYQNWLGEIDLGTLPACELRLTSRCPRYVKNKKDGDKEKRFLMTNRHYNEIADRVAWMKENARHKMLFLTLTLPPFKQCITPKNVENEINKSFSKFVENLTKHYGLTNYLAVREGDGVSKRYHYHLIAVLPFADFRRLNGAWCAAISNICEASKNALTSDKEARFIRSTSSAVRYICKYISKARGQASRTRIIFCDRETAQATVKLSIDHTPEELTGHLKSVHYYDLNEYVTRITIKNNKELDGFINSVVRAFFKVHNKNGTELYHFGTENTQ